MMCRIKFLLLIVFFSCSCVSQDNKMPIAPNDFETVSESLKRSFQRGEEGIPLIIDILKNNLDNLYNTTNYGVANKAIEYLCKYVSEGKKNKEIGDALIYAIKKQIYLPDTLTTAIALKMITGIDVGYDQSFVDSYTEKDELKRQEMINKWQVVIESKK